MPTLEELFKSKKYDTLGNKTPQEAFIVQNSKDIEIKSTSFTLNKLADPLLNKARKNNSIRLGETRLEQENSGLYKYLVVGSPALYGVADTLRITSQSTPLLEAMKAGTGGRGLSFLASQIVGDTVGEAVKFGGSRALGIPSTFQPKSLFAKTAGAARNALGTLIPDVLIPSKIVTNPIFSIKVPGVSEEYRTHEILANLKAIASGTRLATALARSATGTPDQIKQAIQGQVINIAQQETKKFVAKGLSNLLSKGGEKAQQIARDLRLNNNTFVRYSSIIKYSEVVGGEKTFGVNDGLPPNAKGNKADNDAVKRGLDLSNKWSNEYSGEVDNNKRRKLKFAKEMWASAYVENEPKEDESLIYSKSTNHLGIPNRKDFSYKGDTINLSKVVDEPQSQKDAQISDEIDFIPLKFTSVANNTTVQFRATITGLSEQFSPGWENSRFIGSPFNFYNYQSIERTTQFTFKVFSLNSNEHKENWKKLGYLSTLCYPQSYESATGAVSAPFLKFTLGDMYRNKECFIESMTYNIDDDFPWEVGLNDKTLKNYRLPMIVEITMTLKFIESKSSTHNFVTGSTNLQDKKLIGNKMYGWQSSAEDKKEEGKTEEKQKFRSTSNTYKTSTLEQLNRKSSDKIKTDKGEEAWPMDTSEEAQKFRKEQKLMPLNLYHTPMGASTARRIYVQKRTGYYYYGDGTPYTSIFYSKGVGPDLKELVKK